MVQTLGMPHGDDPELTTTITDEAPTTSNVYTDGSVLYPNHRYSQIGT